MSSLKVHSYNQKGFTLLELLLVITIIAVLMSQGIAQYKTYMISTNRQTAITNLQMAQQEMERIFLRSSSYNNAHIQDKLNNLASSSHKIQLYQATETNYLLSAVPIKGDVLCGTLSIDNTGLKTSSVENSNILECW